MEKLNSLKSPTPAPSHPSAGSANVDISSFRKWMVAICAIRFDLEKGQLVEECFPPGAISREEESDVAFSSFPDSMANVHNRASLVDCIFFFRVRRRGSLRSVVSTIASSVGGNVPSHGQGFLGTSAVLNRSATHETRTRRSETIDRQTILADQGQNEGQANGGGGKTGGGEGGDGNGSLLGHNRSQSAPASSVTSPLSGILQKNIFSGSLGDVAGFSKEEEEVKRKEGDAEGDEAFFRRVVSVGDKRYNEVRDVSGISETMGDDERNWDEEGIGGGGRLGAATKNGLRESGEGEGIGGTCKGERGGEREEGGVREGVSEGRKGPRYMYGFVFNRQRHDERLPRGGEQKSVVILTERPYSTLFRRLVQIVGPLYFDNGVKAFSGFAQLVGTWPPPLPGTTTDLKLPNSTLRIHLPPAHTLPPSAHTPLDDFTAAMAPPIGLQINSNPQGIFHEADLFGMYKGVIMHLWVLWELVLIGEPLLVLAPTPSQTSEAVAALVSLIAPLPCSLDFRPYFTIHDPDFPSLNSVRDGDPVPRMLLGVTNLFFLKALKSFPHVLSIGRPPHGGTGVAGAARYGGKMHRNTQVAVRESAPRLLLQGSQNGLQNLSVGSIMNFIAAGARLPQARREGPLSLMSEHKEALWTNYIPTMKPDSSVLNNLVDAPSTASDSDKFSISSSPSSAPSSSSTLSMVNNEILRKHFVELTANFLAPFGPFLRAAAPANEASPYFDPPPLMSFDAHAFLGQVRSRGPGKFLAKRLQPGGWVELYRRFMEGPNFMPWFQRRRAVAEAEQHRLWRRARVEADVRKYVGGMMESELQDGFSVIERQMAFELQAWSKRGEPPSVTKLRGDIRAIFNAMPREMQQKLLFSPKYAALLQKRSLHESPSLPAVPGRASLFSPFRGTASLGSPSRGISLQNPKPSTPQRSLTSSENAKDFPFLGNSKDRPTLHPARPEVHVASRMGFNDSRIGFGGGGSPPSMPGVVNHLSEIASSLGIAPVRANDLSGGLGVVSGGGSGDGDRADDDDGLEDALSFTPHNRSTRGEKSSPIEIGARETSFGFGLLVASPVGVSKRNGGGIGLGLSSSAPCTPLKVGEDGLWGNSIKKFSGLGYFVDNKASEKEVEEDSVQEHANQMDPSPFNLLV